MQSAQKRVIREITHWLPGLAVIALLCGAVLLWGHATTSRPKAFQTAAAHDAAPMTLLWSQPIAGFRGAAVSPQGELVALTSGAKGAVSLWHWRTQPTHPLWVHPATGASSVAVSAAGGSVVAWSALDPALSDFSIFRGADGTTLSHRTLDGAIWDARLSADGCYAGVVTGSKLLYLYTLSDETYTTEDKRVHHWSLDGIGNSIAFPSIGSYLVCGTWDDSGVACYTPQGACLWQYPESAAARRLISNRLFFAQLSGNGRYVLGVSYGNVRQSAPALYLWRTDGGGNPQWKTELGEDAFYPKAQITADGSFVAMSYLRQIVRGNQSLSEHRLRLLDSLGNTVWERGGLLFSPTLVALSPDGQRTIVSDGQRTLYALRQDGRILTSHALPGLLRQSVLSADGHTLLVYTGDGTLSLFKLG